MACSARSIASGSPSASTNGPKGISSSTRQGFASIFVADVSLVNPFRPEFCASRLQLSFDPGQILNLDLGFDFDVVMIGHYSSPIAPAQHMADIKCLAKRGFENTNRV